MAKNCEINLDVMKRLSSKPRLTSISEHSPLSDVLPVADEERQRAFTEALIKTNQKFGRVLKRLAD